MHEHLFDRYVGIPVFGDGTAWVPKRHVEYPAADMRRALPEMWRCECGEQGFEVPV